MNELRKNYGAGDTPSSTFRNSMIDEALAGLERADVPPVAASPANAKPIPCPCCQQAVSVPPLQIVIDHYGISPMQARVLRAVWNGKGHPVKAERIFDAMYVDDYDGGPSGGKMYSTLKVAVCRLRERLQGSGISIENVGRGKGYRLVIGRN